MVYALLFAGLVILVLLTLKYPAVSLLFFLTTAAFKGALMVNVPLFRTVDYTVLCAVFTLFAMGWAFLRHPSRVSEYLDWPLVIYVLLSVFLLLGVLYTSAPHYGLQKGSRFATFGLIAFLAPILFIRSLSEMRLLMWLLMAVGLILAVTTIAAPNLAFVREAAQTRGSFLEASPLETATKLGVAATIAFCLLLSAQTSALVRAVCIGVIGTMIVGIITTASRGPFLGLILVGILAVVATRRGIAKGWFPVVMIAACLVVILPFVLLPDQMTERVSRVFRSTYDASEATLTRLPLYRLAWRGGWDRPVTGHGTGAFAVAFSGTDDRFYPHNFFLELFYEQGVLGVVLGALFIIAVFARWRRAANLVYYGGLGPEFFVYVHAAGLVFLFTLLQAMKSHDLDGNRFMFFSAGLTVASYLLVQRQLAAVEWLDSAGAYSGMTAEAPPAANVSAHIP